MERVKSCVLRVLFVVESDSCTMSAEYGVTMMDVEEEEEEQRRERQERGGGDERGKRIVFGSGRNDDRKQERMVRKVIWDS